MNGFSQYEWRRSCPICNDRKMKAFQGRYTCKHCVDAPIFYKQLVPPNIDSVNAELSEYADEQEETDTN